MRLLLLGLQPPYPVRSGGQIRRWEMLKYLGQRHRVTFLYLSDSNESSAPRPVQEVCERVIPVPRHATMSADDFEIGRNSPMPLKPYGVSDMYRAIADCQPDTFDLVLVDTIFMSMYRELLPPRSVLLEQNIESQIYKRFAKMQETAPAGADQFQFNMTWRAMELYENLMWRQFPLRVVVSKPDRAVMECRCPVGRTIVIPNCVNLQEYSFLPPNSLHSLLFAGTLDYFPNPDAVIYLTKKILPRVRETFPDVSLVVAGRNPSPDFGTISDPPGVRVIANPPSMHEIAAQASVCVVPLRIGGGTRLKIIDALAWGLPVITTTLGCEGLDVTDGRDLLVRDEPDAFAAAIVELFNNRELCITLRENGRALVEARYNCEPIFDKLEAELEAFLESPLQVTP